MTKTIIEAVAAKDANQVEALVVEELNARLTDALETKNQELATSVSTEE